MAQPERKRKRRTEPGRGFGGVIVLNDQGGAVMEVTVEMTATLRAQDHGHPPLIFDARGNGGGGYFPNHHRRSPEPGDGLHGNRADL